MHQNHRIIRITIVVATTLFLGSCAIPDQSPPAQEASRTPTSSASGPTLVNEPEPTASAVAPPEFLTYTTVDGMFEFTHPADWSVVADPASADQEGAGRSVTVRDGQGRKMAALVTGFPAVNDSVVAGPIKPVPLEYSKIPEVQIPTTFEDTAIAFHYETKYNPVLGEVGAEMSINSFKAESPITSSLPGFHIDSVTGASFTRWIGASEDLPDIDPAVRTGGDTALFEAYQQTSEYQAVKAMMLSLRKLA